MKGTANREDTNQLKEKKLNSKTVSFITQAQNGQIARSFALCPNIYTVNYMG
jgi:hypothetical protein